MTLILAAGIFCLVGYQYYLGCALKKELYDANVIQMKMAYDAGDLHSQLNKSGSILPAYQLAEMQAEHESILALLKTNDKVLKEGADMLKKFLLWRNGLALSGLLILVVYLIF